MVEELHVMLDHAEPSRLGVLPGARRILLALECGALGDISPGTMEAGLLVVPEHEPDRSLGAHVRRRQ